MKVLFIGDLRNCYNYGAIATTESLIKMLLAKYPNAEIKYIDFRSLQNATPPDGWGREKIAEAKNSNDHSNLLQLIKIKMVNLYYLMKHFLKFFMPYGIVKIRDRIIKQDIPDKKIILPTMNYHIPFLFKNFDKWAKDMMNGKVLEYERNLFEWADIVLVNGEGNVVNGTDENGVYRHRACYVLFMSWVAKTQFHLPVYLVNHCVDPNNSDAVEIIKNVYPLLDRVIVRDPLSLEKLVSYGIINNAEYAPDALFSYKGTDVWEPSDSIRSQIDFSKPFILIGDSSGIKNAYSKVSWNVQVFFKSLIERLQNIVPQLVFVDGYSGGNEDINQLIMDTGIGRISLENCSYQELYEVMKRAEIFVSGRWHASILCLLTGTPILLYGSDSHKTKSLYSMIDYQYKFFETISLPIHIDEIADEVEKILKNRHSIVDDIKEKCRILKQQSWRNVDCIEDFYDGRQK